MAGGARLLVLAGTIFATLACAGAFAVYSHRSCSLLGASATQPSSLATTTSVTTTTRNVPPIPAAGGRCGAAGRSSAVLRASSAAPTASAASEARLKHHDASGIPSLGAIARFAGPALALWLTGPLMSLIDASAVGLTEAPGRAALAEATQQLAALGPATTFIDGSSFLFAFINVATTNLYATALANGDEDEARLVVRVAVGWAWRCGLGVMAVLYALGPSLLRLYVGAQAATILPSASAYVLIRAVSMPTLLIANAIQSAMLGGKNSITPLVALLAATALNCLGDLALVWRANLGCAGAALATVFSQWIGLALLITGASKTIFSRPTVSTDPMAAPSAPVASTARRWSSAAAARLKKPPSATTGTSWWAHGDEKEASAAAAEQAQARARVREASSRFLGFAPPVLLVVIGKMAAFGFMTHAAAALGPVALAAHQVALSVFFLISPFSEVFSQTMQAFLPPLMRGGAEAAPEGGGPATAASPSSEKEGMEVPDSLGAGEDHVVRAARQAKRAAARKMERRLLLRIQALAGAVGLVVAAAAGAVPRFGAAAFTRSPAVAAAMKPLAAPLAASALIHSFICSAEGALLARRDLAFLGGVYAASALVMPAWVISLKLRGAPLGALWRAFVVFQAARAAVLNARVHLTASRADEGTGPAVVAEEGGVVVLEADAREMDETKEQGAAHRAAVEDDGARAESGGHGGGGGGGGGGDSSVVHGGDGGGRSAGAVQDGDVVVEPAEAPPQWTTAG